MTVTLSCFVTPAPLIAARERGLLDGADVDERATSGSPEQLRGLLDRELDIVVTALDNLFEWTAAGAEVVLVGQVEPTTPLAVVARAGVERLRDLERRRFAVDAFGNGFALAARHLLGEQGVTPIWHEVGGVRERFEALLEGRTDATLLGPPFIEQAVEAGASVLARIQDEHPDFPGQGLVVRADRFDAPEVRAALAALIDGGLLPVDPAGLELLSRIRRDLGLLDRDSGFPDINRSL